MWYPSPPPYGKEAALSEGGMNGETGIKEMHLYSIFLSASTAKARRVSSALQASL
ncbi:unnamed protein product, partial [Ixodes pacificus]